MLEALHMLTAISLGIFAGAQLAEACILVPFWRGLPPSDFFDLHHSMGPRLFRFFAPVTAFAVLLAIVSALLSDGELWQVSAGVLSFIALAIFFAYFKAANAAFAARSFADEQLPAKLKRWAGWHLARTVVVTGAFIGSVLAL